MILDPKLLRVRDDSEIAVFSVVVVLKNDLAAVLRFLWLPPKTGWA